MKPIVFIDAEIDPQTKQILDLGAVKTDRTGFHSPAQQQFAEFIKNAVFIGGHNILNHDLHYLKHTLPIGHHPTMIDTLYLSPLLFPNQPYHALLKDDKFNTDELNNPFNDSVKAMELFFDEVNAFAALPTEVKEIFFYLLHNQSQFGGFFTYLAYQPSATALPVASMADHLGTDPITALIRKTYDQRLCEYAPLSAIIQNHPIELAYCLALIYKDDRNSRTPPWVHRNFPITENIMKLLRQTPCENKCGYCRKYLDLHGRLFEFFKYRDFRRYNGEPLQSKAAEAALGNRSLLAVFPTGGGKSITFQLPALIAGEVVRGLTVIISPLQSLMKDQVDNLTAKGIYDAVTVNGMLSPIERAKALECVENGMASLLYISPESLRSRTLEKLLLSRNVVRFVVDEAHCFSSWGQDFRVDYLYIGEFMRELQTKKNLREPIPVSCFTATAKPKVISDIRDYFKQKLGLELELYTTDAERSNLHYTVLYQGTEAEKYQALRDLIAWKDCPAICYVSRTRKTFEIAGQLTRDGFPARPFNGKMDAREKVANQEAFINGEVKTIVATSAFGMGVDKRDVGLVVHYDISDSLENYVQEAGRAGRDQKISADCYVLFNENDLNKHFILLNQTKLSISEIGQVWKAIKDLTKARASIQCSALEIARQAGWEEAVYDVETRVRTAVSALELAGYLKRGKNMPRVFANSILAATMAEASEKISRSQIMDARQKENASRIMKSLISSRSIAAAQDDAAESRVDYLADRLGLTRQEVIATVTSLRAEKLLDDTKDLTAYIRRAEDQNKSQTVLQRFALLEKYMLTFLDAGQTVFNLKEMNSQADNPDADGTVNHGSSVKAMKTLLYYWVLVGEIAKTYSILDTHVQITPQIEIDVFTRKCERRIALAQFIVDYLYEKSWEAKISDINHEKGQGKEKEEILVLFSVLEIKNAYEDSISLFKYADINFDDIENALLYLDKINALKLEGGFLVVYNAMEIKRLLADNRLRYKREDYQQLNDFYRHKIQQIHIIGEYANMMVRDYQQALQFVKDYFHMDYKQFITKYFKGSRRQEIERNITAAQYQKLFGELSSVQREIIDDDISRYIVVTAGPGSGKTRVLVHKLASLYQLEDVKQDQLLMLTFSRAAATEFKRRLYDLIGNAAHYVDIQTFHSFCFNLLGRVGNIEEADKIIKNAVELINKGEAENGNITKTVVVIDEAQDMDANEYQLIKAMMECNEEMRVIAVGDDDQNIYEFRGSSSKYLQTFMNDYQATRYELTDNYRSSKQIVTLANAFSRQISVRLKSMSIKAVKPDDGLVRLFRHSSRNLEIPLIRNIKETYQGEKAGVLTNTNDEALMITSLLIKEGFRARLIQSNEDFNLFNLVELRFFLQLVGSKTASPMIAEETWAKAYERLNVVYESSVCLELCLNLLNIFADSNRKKYLSDLEIFIKETQWDDLYRLEDCAAKKEIIVSTMHKAKGREFDHVYLMLNHVNPVTDADKRKIYVGITRAAKALYIHYNQDRQGVFALSDSSGMEMIYDARAYAEPQELMMQLTHKDIFLDFFKNKKKTIINLRSGEELVIKGHSLFTKAARGDCEVVRFSKKYQEHLAKLVKKGYYPVMSRIRFIIMWKGENDVKESLIILPDIYFLKA